MKDSEADFAIIGHQANWHDVLALVNGMRKQNNPLDLSDVKALFTALPPRSLFDIKVTSNFSKRCVHGKYIETFISPDSLMDTGSLHNNIEKVKEATVVAISRNIPITTLGGFTSILLEGKIDGLSWSKTSHFTTGNTLTAALIIEGVRKACAMFGKNPSEHTLLIIGATGDVGSACARYFNSVFQKVLAVARNKARLDRLSEELELAGISTDLNSFVPKADVIISAASTRELVLNNLKQDVLIADAGYPKNISAHMLPEGAHIFHAGMGQLPGGYSFTPRAYMDSYVFPLQDIGHGCGWEAALLALDNRIEPYSTGRGNITIERIEEIMTMAGKHKIGVAPFYNDMGLWEPEYMVNDEG